MQAVRETIRCSTCGCIALPDANKCPKCGTAYDRKKPQGIIATISHLSSPMWEMKEADIRVIRAYYQLTCPRHGKIHVRSTVIGAPVKCPFCE